MTRAVSRKRLITQEKIVFAIFVLLFLGFSLFLPGFLTANNVALLLQSVSVLGILSVGEAEAWAFLVGTAPGTPAPADGQDSAGDAERLAARLRALALVVMLAQRFALPGITAPRAADGDGPAGHVGRPASSAAPDTS